MNERGYEVEYKIDMPKLDDKEYFDSEKNQVETGCILLQEITIKLTKTTFEKL